MFSGRLVRVRGGADRAAAGADQAGAGDREQIAAIFERHGMTVLGRR